MGSIAGRSGTRSSTLLSSSLLSRPPITPRDAPASTGGGNKANPRCAEAADAATPAQSAGDSVISPPLDTRKISVHPQGPAKGWDAAASSMVPVQGIFPGLGGDEPVSWDLPTRHLFATQAGGATLQILSLGWTKPIWASAAKPRVLVSKPEPAAFQAASAGDGWTWAPPLRSALFAHLWVQHPGLGPCYKSLGKSERDYLI